MNKRLIFFVIIGLIIFAVAVRVLPHYPNATPLTAIAFVASIYLRTKWALFLPMIVLLLSDFILGFYDWRIMASVYGSFLLIGGLSWLSKKYGKTLPVLLYVTGSSLVFFLITNAFVWFFSPWYEKSLSGLLYAYELGLPFLRAMFVGDLVYGLALVTVFELALYVVRHPVEKAKTIHCGV